MVLEESLIRPPTRKMRYKHLTKLIVLVILSLACFQLYLTIKSTYTALDTALGHIVLGT